MALLADGLQTIRPSFMVVELAAVFGLLAFGTEFFVVVVVATVHTSTHSFHQYSSGPFAWELDASPAMAAAEYPECVLSVDSRHGPPHVLPPFA
jgi:hypothetical protein